MSFQGTEHEAIAEVYLKSVVSVLVNDVWLVAKDVSAILGQPLFMISAWNPGIELSAEENAQLSHELEVQLTAAEYNWKPAIGKDPDSEYFEPSYVITNISQADALKIARKYKQVAIFRITDEALTVIMCDTETEKHRKFN